jgi:homoserine O-acetyltransferase
MDLVERRVFVTRDYVTRGGAPIPEVRIGYQTAGRLNAAGDNAVLVTHYFSGSAHAWGRYEEGGPAGFWDTLIGPGRAIDTDRYFVVASDTLVNLNVRDGRTVTTGPATVNPATGRPWGTAFPVVAIRDFVEVQKRLLDDLGVTRLAMVAGPSMGGMQAVEWTAAYPAMVERVMTAISGAWFDPWMLSWLDIWTAPVRLDPDWKGGEYGDGPGPVRGLAEAFKVIAVHAQDRGALAPFGRVVAEGPDPARDLAGRFQVTRAMDDAAAERARLSDANHLLYMARANQLFLHDYPSTEAALANSRARWLVVPSPTDHVWLPSYSHDLAAVLRGQGRDVAMAEVTGPFGHLNGIVPGSLAVIAPAVAAFLAA